MARASTGACCAPFTGPTSVVTNDNTASDVWADTACRSRSNEA